MPDQYGPVCLSSGAREAGEASESRGLSWALLHPLAGPDAGLDTVQRAPGFTSAMLCDRSCIVGASLPERDFSDVPFRLMDGGDVALEQQPSLLCCRQTEELGV
ncbi:hypothetical protein KUCAC02_030627 [Chaenocephalus aceratus]|uniref:Uncharacterized protein n=1 Tax=Chaenocephalus aceratus TaxID=36190 RepID=A0ACB9XK23_CHAAC|nr:hypothetical protein KUCAC02_030627 [Chaenocephalus aceratus]